MGCFSSPPHTEEGGIAMTSMTLKMQMILKRFLNMVESVFRSALAPTLLQNAFKGKTFCKASKTAETGILCQQGQYF